MFEDTLATAFCATQNCHTMRSRSSSNEGRLGSRSRSRSPRMAQIQPGLLLANDRGVFSCGFCKLGSLSEQENRDFNHWVNVCKRPSQLLEITHWTGLFIRYNGHPGRETQELKHGVFVRTCKLCLNETLPEYLSQIMNASCPQEVPDWAPELGKETRDWPILKAYQMICFHLLQQIQIKAKQRALLDQSKGTAT